MVLTGDLNADPLVIPATAQAISCGLLIDLEEACALRIGEQPSPTCIYDLAGLVPGGILFVVGPNALASAYSCHVQTERWVRPHFAVSASFGFGAWSAEVQFARAVSPLSPVCWMTATDEARSSSFKEAKPI